MSNPQAANLDPKYNTFKAMIIPGLRIPSSFWIEHYGQSITFKVLTGRKKGEGNTNMFANVDRVTALSVIQQIRMCAELAKTAVLSGNAEPLPKPYVLETAVMRGQGQQRAKTHTIVVGLNENHTVFVSLIDHKSQDEEYLQFTFMPSYNSPMEAHNFNANPMPILSSVIALSYATIWENYILNVLPDADANKGGGYNKGGNNQGGGYNKGNGGYNKGGNYNNSNQGGGYNNNRGNYNNNSNSGGGYNQGQNQQQGGYNNNQGQNQNQNQGGYNNNQGAPSGGNAAFGGSDDSYD